MIDKFRTDNKNKENQTTDNLDGTNFLQRKILSQH